MVDQLAEELLEQSLARADGDDGVPLDLAAIDWDEQRARFRRRGIAERTAGVVRWIRVYGLPRLRRQMVQMSLGLGIGAASVVGGFIDGALRNPLPFSNPDQLVLGIPGGGSFDQEEGDRIAACREADFAPYAMRNVVRTDAPRAPVYVAAATTDDLFRILGVVSDDSPSSRGGSRRAYISAALWQREFRGSVHVVGSTIRLDDDPVLIAGVMPKDFRYPRWADLWVIDREPTRSTALPGLLGSGRDVFLVGRLARASGSRFDQQRALGSLRDCLARSGSSVSAELLGEALTLGHRPLLVALRLIVLLVAAALGLSVALEARTRLATLQNELAIRAALGRTAVLAAVTVLARELVVGLLSALVGGAVAFYGCTHGSALEWLIAPAGVARVPWHGIAGAVALLLTSMGLALLGLGSHQGNASKPSWAVRLARPFRHGRGLVVAIVVLDVVLAGAVLTVLEQALPQLLRPLGFDRGQLVVFYLYPPNGQVVAAVDRLRGLERLYGVRGFAAATEFPMDGDQRLKEVVTAQSKRALAVDVGIDRRYFAVMGGRLLAGRDFAATDSVRSTPVAIVSQGLAKVLWPSGSAIGRTLTAADAPNAPIAVVGIAEDLRQAHGLREPEGTLYRPLPQVAVADFAGIVEADQGVSLDRLRSEIVARVPGTAPKLLRRAGAAVADALRSERSQATVSLLGALAGLSTLLMSASLATVLWLRSQARELALRSALGATPLRLALLVTARAASPVLLGALLGSGLLIWVSRFAAWFPETHARGLLRILVVGATIAVGGVLTCALVALRSYRSATSTATGCSERWLT